MEKSRRAGGSFIIFIVIVLLFIIFIHLYVRFRTFHNLSSFNGLLLEDDLSVLNIRFHDRGTLHHILK